MFVAHVSRLRTGLLVAGAIAFVGTGVFLVAQPDTGKRVVGLAAIVLFGAFAAIGTRQFLRSGPMMEVDVRGILWRRWSDEVIAWPAIDRAAVKSMKGQRFLCLWLHDPAAHRSTRLLGRLAAANRSLGYGDIALGVQGTDRSFAELVAAVAAYRDVERGRGGR